MIVLVIFLILILFIIFIINNKLLYVKIEAFDNNIYYVNDLPDAQDAANFLAKIMKILNELVIKIIDNYNILDTNDKKYIESIKKIKDKLPFIKISENPLDNKYTSYSINKGEELVLCIRDKKTKKIQDINDILYVAIHEIAHIGCLEYGHTEIFNEINYYLLKKAVEYDYYKYIDYYKNNKPYCGIQLTSTLL